MKVIAMILSLILQPQASDVRVQPAYPPHRQPSTPEAATRLGYDYVCTFAEPGAADRRISLQLRGGRGYWTSKADFPVSRTPRAVEILTNETSADFSMVPAVREDDDVVIISSKVDGRITALLTIQPPWSSYSLDGKSRADLDWGPILEDGSRRWFAQSLDGSCHFTEVAQAPLSDHETSELLAQ